MFNCDLCGHDFLTAFRASFWKNHNNILFIDKLDELDIANDEIREQFLKTLQQYKQNYDLYAIHSVLACGTFSIQELTSKSSRRSLFNVANYLQIQYFDQRQTQRFFDEFAQDYNIMIDPAVIDDI
jgi:hypothetical protein